MKTKLALAFIAIVAVVLAAQLLAAPTDLALLNTANGPHVFARSKPQHINAQVLAASTAESNAVPSGAKFVFFASTGNFYARPDGLVAVPSADVTDGTAGEINPTVWDVSTVTNIAIVAPAAVVVTLSYYVR